jgi:hypothetical protein
MNWKRMLVFITGSVGQELLLRNEYLLTENRLLRRQLEGRLQLTDPERISLAKVGKQLGRIAFAACGEISLLPAQAARFVGDDPQPLGFGRFPAQFPKMVFPELALPGSAC